MGCKFPHRETPFPIPRKFECPYCGQEAKIESFNDKTSCVEFICQQKREVINVGRREVYLYIKHTFYTVWNNEKWQYVDLSHYGSHEVEEYIQVVEPGWRVIKDEEFKKVRKTMIQLKEEYGTVNFTMVK